MAKFCTNCGKKLEEGKECSCTKEKSSIKTVSSSGFMDDIKVVLKDALKLFTKPMEVVENKEVSKYSWIINLIIQTLAIFLTFIIGVGFVMSLLTGGLTSGFGGLNIGLGDIPAEYYVKTIVAAALGSLAFLFVFVSLIYLVATKILKKEAKYQDVLNKFSYPSLIISGLLLVFILACYVHEYVAVAVLSFGCLYFVVIVYQFIKTYFKIEENKNLLWTPIILMVTSLAGSLVTQKIIEILFKINS